MNLVRLNPFTDVNLLQNQMNRLFDSALQGWQGESAGTTSWIPAADIYESDEDLVVNLDLPGIEVEQMYVNVLEDVKRTVKIPVAIKLGPFFSNMAHMAKRLCNAGADGLVLFNRFYQPDIDLEQLEVVPNVLLSTPQAMRLPLRWIAILHGRLQVSFAATSGIHNSEDVIKMLMVGADVTMLCSTLLKNGLGRMKQIEEELVKWMEDHEYTSVSQMKGSMSQKSCPHPSAFERANYMKALKSYV